MQSQNCRGGRQGWNEAERQRYRVAETEMQRWGDRDGMRQRRRYRVAETEMQRWGDRDRGEQAAK